MNLKIKKNINRIAYSHSSARTKAVWLQKTSIWGSYGNSKVGPKCCTFPLFLITQL